MHGASTWHQLAVLELPSKQPSKQLGLQQTNIARKRAHTHTHTHSRARARVHMQAALERVLGSPELFGAPVLILANKQDIEGSAGAQEVAEMFGIGKIDTRPIKVMPVCAYTGQGLRESVEWLVQAIRASTRTSRLRVKHAR